MNKEYNKNTINQAETKRKQKGFSRQEQYEHPQERKESFASRRRGKKKVTYKELGEIYPGRNGKSYKITLSANTRNNKKSALEDIYNNNMQACDRRKRRTVKVFPTFTITVERITPFSDKFVYHPPKVAAAPPKKKYKTYTYIMKPFAEFTRLDWHLWHKADEKARGVYWAESNRRDKQRAQGKPWDKYYRKSESGLLREQTQPNILDPSGSQVH